MLSARFLARVAGTIAEGFAVLILTAIPLPPAFAQSTVCGATLHAQPGCGSSNDHFAISPGTCAASRTVHNDVNQPARGRSRP